jgi:hypothetical protein
MSCFGNLIGPAADRVGIQMVVQEPSIEVYLSMSISSILASTNGLIGEFKPISRSQCHIFGRRKYLNITRMMMKRSSRSLERLQKMTELEE